MTDLDESAVLAILESYRNDPQQIIAALLDVQEASGRSYVERAWAAAAAGALKVPVSRVYEILTFYSNFSLEPRGRHVAEVCLDGPCLLNGGSELMERLSGAMGVEEGGTSGDGSLTLEGAGCCGRCAGAPVVRVGDVVYTVRSADEAQTLVRSFREDDPVAREALKCVL
ncbi:MAG: NAD(P)H-dependent oxidoreductase subunit E [Deltaproteobacteria bacterium]|jgi:NADH-quinone oxidoreductase subunit E|nr:NAD(P)H-dependent oxidoreductase subunit E [Deltaproteobacteria bacterium]